jgi:glycosyltransferase involved in cell wall biosynthesis
MHQTYYSENNFTNVKKVCTVYDLTNEKFPNFFPQSNNITNLKKKTILNSDHVICISDNTKKDLINFFNINPDKVTTTLLASDLYCPDVTLKKKKLRNYILFVGSRGVYKNFEGLLNAYSSSSFLKNNFKIALFGGERFGENELQYIYSNVAALVYPSIYEGFGLPIVEAMSCGCPVISSLAGSTKEVGGDGIEYFEPLDISKMKNLIENLVTSDHLQETKIAYGYKRAKLFSWKKCAQETLEIYKKVISA